jgi:hypothetical protein
MIPDSATDFNIAAWVRESRAAQGLPPTIEDQEALDNFAALVAGALTRASQAKAASGGTSVREIPA